MCALPVTDYLIVGSQYEQQVIQPSVSVSKEFSPSELEQITHLLHQGKVLMGQKNYQQSLNMFDQGIKQLGDRYVSDQLDDDTDLKLMLAGDEQQKGNLAHAAHLKCNVLDARIQLYKELQRNQSKKTKF